MRSPLEVTGATAVVRRTVPKGLGMSGSFLAKTLQRVIASRIGQGVC